MTTLMKDSGIDWIGKIPENWKVKRVKDIVNLRGGGIDKKIIEGEKIVNLVNFTDVFKLKKLDNNLDYMQVSCREDKISNVSLIKNDLLITPSSETAKEIGIVNIVLEDLINSVYSYHILRMRLKDKKNSAKFLYYYFNSKFSKFQFENKALGITRVTLSRGDINENILFVPPLETQQKIAEYLDVEVSKLDKQVSLLERKYALLGDYKDALIFETVTQGLDKSVLMKDSGIDWIGQIPEGWKVKRLKNMISNLGGGNYGFDIETLDKESVLSKCFSISDFKNGNLNSKNLNEIKMDRVYEKNNTIKKGTLLIEKCGGTKANPVGRIIIVEDNVSAYYTNFVQGVRVNKFMNSKYLHYQLQTSYNLRLHMNNVKQTTGIQNFNFIKFASEIIFLNPPLETQQKIADYLDVEVEKLDKQRELIKRKVELLKEYKEALIFEVVTGKKEVK